MTIDHNLDWNHYFIISTLRDYLHQSGRTVIPDDVDIEQICYYGKIHQIEGILYYQTKLVDLQKGFASAIYNFANRKKVLSDLLYDIGCNYVLVKGESISVLYKNPELRTMGDVDILVHSEDRRKFASRLIQLGFSDNTQFIDCEWEYNNKSGIMVELHDGLVYPRHSSYQEVVFFHKFGIMLIIIL